MPDYHTEAEHHLRQAALFRPGSEDERYHTSTASILASLHVAETQRGQTEATTRVAVVQEQLYALLMAAHTVDQTTGEVTE